MAFALAACGPSAPEADAHTFDAARALEVGHDSALEEPGDTGPEVEPPDAISVELELTPERLVFPMAQPGCTRSGELTVANVGRGSAEPLSFAISGRDAPHFSVASTDCPGSLPPGARCTVTVELSPLDVGALEALLVVGAAGREATAELVGLSAHDGCGFPPRFSPFRLDFGDVIVGETSAPQTLSVINSDGGATGTLTIGVSGANAGSFVVTRDTCSGTSLPGGLSCELDVVMSPVTVGDLVASVELTTSIGAMASATMTGRGTAASSGAAP